jgi:hypothetical protein
MTGAQFTVYILKDGSRAKTIFHSLGGVFWGIHRARMLIANMLYGGWKKYILEIVLPCLFPLLEDGNTFLELILLYLYVA